MTNGYVAFLKPRTAYERMTALLDGGQFCHVELMVERNPDGTWQTISSLPNSGVRMRNVTLQGKHWVKIPVQVDNQYCKVWYTFHKGQKYDWVGLATTKVPFINGHKGKWFCSELVATLLNLPNPQSMGIQDLYHVVKR